MERQALTDKPKYSSTEREKKHQVESKMYPKIPKEEDSNEYEEDCEEKTVSPDRNLLRERQQGGSSPESSTPSPGSTPGASSPFIPERYSTKTVRETKSSSTLRNVLLAVILVAVSAIAWWYLLPGSSPDGARMAAEIVGQLRSEFARQPNMTFRVIEKALMKALQPAPKAPAVLLLFASEREGGAECRRLGRRLAALVSRDHGTVLGGELRALSPDKGKKEIEGVVRRSLGGGPGAVLIEDLDSVPFGAAGMLHSYTDHEHAPFRRAAFVMTVFPPDVPDADDVLQWDGAVYAHLEGVWVGESAGIDQVSSLLSRITVSAALVRKGAP